MGICIGYRSPVHVSPFASHNAVPTFVVWPSSQSSLDSIIETFNSTAQRCKQEIDEGVFKHVNRVVFFFHDGDADDLLRRARSIFAPHSHFRTLPKVALAVASSHEEGKILIYRDVQNYLCRTWVVRTV